MKKLSITSALRACGRYRFRCYEPGTQVLRREFSFPNLVLDGGITRMLEVLAGTESELELATLEIGTGGTSVAPEDTALDEFVADVPRSLRELTGNELLLTYFIPDAILPEGEYKEVGIRIGETGPLFSRAVLSPTYTKSVSEDLIVEYTLALSNAT